MGIKTKHALRIPFNQPVITLAHIEAWAVPRNWGSRVSDFTSKFLETKPIGFNLPHGKIKAHIHTGPLILLMAQKSGQPVEVGSLSHDLQGFIHHAGFPPSTVLLVAALNTGVLH